MILLDTGRSDRVWAVAFHPDGKHVLVGNDDGIRRWQIADGEEVGKQIGMELLAMNVSKDHKWIACGTTKGASLWDGEMREKVVDVEGENTVYAVDISPDSTRFATGTRAREANIWSITVTGKRLVGPLKHDYFITGIRFSPTGNRIATACNTLIRIFDSQTGDQLVTVKIDIPRWGATSPLAWSSDGQQIFTASRDNKVRAFDASTGTQLAESQILPDSNDSVHSIALAANNKFITTFAGHSISFLDTSTLGRIGPVIEDSEQIWSVTVSLDSRCLATGRWDGKIVIRDLGKILPDSYGPFNVSICVLILLAC